MSEKEDARGIVSLREKSDGRMIFGHLGCEGRLGGPDTDTHIYIDSVGYEKSHFHIHRNLAAMPHKDFGRKCVEADIIKGYYLTQDRDGDHRTHRNSGSRVGNAGRSIAFLDETPDIKITVEINGKTSSLSDISEETLLNIRRESTK